MLENRRGREKKIRIRFRGFCTHNANGNYVSLTDIKISAVIFLSGLEMCVKKKSLSSNFRTKKKYVVKLKNVHPSQAR